jgi:transposase
MCAVLVGLPDITIEGVGEWPSFLRIQISSVAVAPVCGGCDRSMHGHGRRVVELVDLPVFGRPARLVWRKQRWRCPGCGATATVTDGRIASARCALTRRAAVWATFQVGRHGRSVREVAFDLGCDWHTVMDAVMLYGTPLINDPDRYGTVTAVGLDETLFARTGRFRKQLWSTQIVDVQAGQLLDIVEGRDAAGPIAWFRRRPLAWIRSIEWATIDLSAAYKSVFEAILENATLVADPFHVGRRANDCVDDCRRRVQNETLQHRGRRNDPLYRLRRKLTMARERLTDDQHERMVGLLRLGDPRREVWFAWNAKEVVRQIYDHHDPRLAAEWVDQIIVDFADREMPIEVRQLGRTIKRWRDPIIAWHTAHVTNGPTEAINNLVKRVKRVSVNRPSLARC